MKCQPCGSEVVVKNGRSRACRKACGERDQRRVDPAKRASALAHYLAGVGLRATERLVGVSHNAVMHWVLAEVEGQALAAAKPEEVEGVEADELWTQVGRKKRPAGCGGLFIVLPTRSAAGCWGIVEPTQPAAWMRRFLTPPHITFCTAFWHPCGLIFAPHRHRQDKAHTGPIESHNNRLRVYLARLRR